eukprot:6185569-Pleurochrysis_carterae.AAC.1
MSLGDASGPFVPDLDDASKFQEKEPTKNGAEKAIEVHMVDQETPRPVSCTDVNDLDQQPADEAIGPSGAMNKSPEKEPFENESDKVVEVVMIDHTPTASIVDLLSDTNTDMGQEHAESASLDQQPTAEKLLPEQLPMMNHLDAAASVTPPASTIADNSG